MAANVQTQNPTPIYRGEDAVITFSPLASGQRDLTGLTCVYTLQLNGVVSSVTPTVVVTGGASSTIAVTFTRAQTSALIPTIYEWDLWIVQSGGYERIAGGSQLIRNPNYPPA